jgi:peroxiredoxin
MRSIARNCALTTCFVLAVNVGSIRAVEPGSNGAANDDVKTELIELGKEYQRLVDESQRTIPPGSGGLEKADSEISDQQWLKQVDDERSKNADPNWVMLPRFLALAKGHPDSPFALDALVFVIQRGGPSTGNVSGLPWRLKEQAIDMVSEHHMDDPRIVHVFESLSGSIPSRKTEAFLRHALEKSPNRTTRAAAGLYLASYLYTFSRCHDQSEKLKDKASLLNMDRFWKLVVTPYLEENFPYDHAKVSAEMERLLNDVIQQYSDVAASDWKYSGPAGVFLESEDYPKPKTYGDLARSLLFELNHLVPGKQAPDIEGTDADGKRFRLSDYRGKVVLLTFSADWCGSCIEMYPRERQVVDKFRDQPFALLGVSLDERIESLKKSQASGEITWRCWWDGVHGPIREAWNSPGAPTFYLLDQNGIIQDVRLSRGTTREEFERAIAALLTKVPATESPTR